MSKKENENSQNTAKCLRSHKPCDTWFTNSMYPQDKADVSNIIDASEVIQCLDENEPDYLHQAMDQVLQDLQVIDTKWCFVSQYNENANCKRMRSLRNFVSKVLLHTDGHTEHNTSFDQNTVAP